MDIKGILAELQQERDRLDRAIAALEALGEVAVNRKPGRQKLGGTNFPFGANTARGGRPKMSAAARRNISQGMKQRWAARRKASQ